MKQINFFKIYAQASAWALPFLAVILFLSLRQCHSNSMKLISVSMDLDSVARQAQHFENSRGQIIAENQQLRVESARELRQLTDTIFALKRDRERKVKTVQDYARIIQQFKASDKFAPFTEDAPDTTKTAEAKPQPADTNLIRVPRPFMYMDSTIIFGGRVTKLGVQLDSIRIENTLHYREVVNKTGFLRLGRSSTVQVLNTNPAITTLGVTSVTVPQQVSWWHRWGKPVAFAILAGVAVDHFKR
jgi:hypothetical protein